MPETTNKEAINQSVSFDAIRIGLASPEKIRENGPAVKLKNRKQSTIEH